MFVNYLSPMNHSYIAALLINVEFHDFAILRYLTNRHTYYKTDRHTLGYDIFS